MQPAYCIFIKPCYTYLSIVLHNVKKESEGNTYMKKRILSMLLALVMLATLLPLGLIDTAEAATGAQILTPTSGTSGTGANGGTWKCSSAGDTLTLTDYDGYPIETDATTIRFSGTNTITVPLSNLSGALRVYGLKLTSTKDIWMRGEDGSSLNIVFKPGSGTEDVDVSGIDADGPLLIDTAGDITISAPYGYPYGIRARQGLDYSGPGALDITVRGSYFWKSNHWCAAYGIAAEKGAISLSGSGSKTIRVQSGANTQQISSTPYGIYHKGGTGSSGTATISVDTGALHIEMNGDGCGIYNMGSADSAYVNINNVPELSIEKADSAIETAYSGTVNVRNSKLRIANGRYAIRNSGGTINMENADVTAAVRGSSVGYTDAAVHTGTLQVKGSSTVDMTATYGTVVYARAVSVNLSNGSFTAKTGQSKWPPIDAPVTLGVKTRLMTGVCSDADTGKYAGEKVDDLYVTSFASVESGTCGENVKWTLTRDGTLTISGTGTMVDYPYSTSAPWRSFRSQVKTVVIENGVTSIGNNAFYNCLSLTSVTIPSSVTSIGNNAFYDCTSLTSVTIPGSVTSIGDRAFYGCSSMTDVYYGGYGIGWLAVDGHGQIPDSATVHFKDNLYDSGTCGKNVNWMLDAGGTLTISGTGAMADYYSALYRGSAPWYNIRSQVKKVLIKSGVTSIGRHAFKDCKSLTSVTIPDSVTRIGGYAFEDCTSLTSITIPHSVAEIEEYAFVCCAALTCMTIPNSVKRISEGTFAGCSALTDVYYDGYGIDWLDAGGRSSGIPNSATVHFKDDLYGKGTCGENVNWVMTVDGTLTISGTGNMVDYSWGRSSWYVACSRVNAVIIENGVTRIGSYAFKDCTLLTSVTIPSSVTSIGSSAFENCTSLTSVTIPSSVTSIDDYAFEDCTSLTSITIPSSVTSIGMFAFSGCSALTDVYYDGYGIDWLAVNGHPDSATVHFKDDLYGKGECGIHVNWVMTADGTLTISGTGRISNYDDTNSAPWAKCRDYIKRLVIEDGVRGIGAYAFYCCSALTSVTIPSSVTSIGLSAFDGCKSLTSVTIPSSVTSIGMYAFYGCSSLTSVTIPDSVTSIENSTFYNCSSLTGVTIPNSVTSIGMYAFYGCSALTSVTIPNGVTSIGDGAFFDCTSLTNMTIPNSVTIIESSAFKNCTSLTSVKLPSALQWINPEMFSNCVRLTSVTIPKSVTSIGEKAFYYCDSLTDVHYGGSKADWAKITIKNGNEDLQNATLHTKESTRPANVTLVSAKAVSGGIQVTWKEAAGAATYKVYRKDAANPDWTALTTTATGTSYVDKTAKAGVKYTYTVRGVAKDGKTLSPSHDKTGVSATATPSRPANVTLVSAKAVSGGIQVTWKEAAGAATYKVYRKDATNPDWTALTTTATGTSYVDKTAKAGVKYTYTVRGVAKDGKTLSPSHDKTGVSATATPARVALVDAKRITTGTKGIQVRWKSAANAQTYNVYRAANPPTDKKGNPAAVTSGWKLVGKQVNGLSFKDTTGQPGVTYAYTVRGVAADGKTRSATYNEYGVRATMPKR